LEGAGVDIVVGHHVHYIPNFNWGAIADECGYPYFVIHRENLFISEYIRKHTMRRISRLGKFEGSYVSVHNDVAREVISDSRFVSNKDIHVLGCIRMDRFLNRLKTPLPQTLDKTVITMFTYLAYTIPEGDGMHEQCKDVHRLLVQIACEKPNIDIYMKVKPSHYISWKQMMEEATADCPGILDKLDNLHISTTIPAHDLIERSNVVIGFNSTTVLEASIAGRHVIVPYFGAWREDRCANFIYLPDKMNLFNVPSDIDDLKRRIFVCLKQPAVDDGQTKERRELFEEFVSPLDGSATEKHINLILLICQERRRIQLESRNKKFVYDGTSGTQIQK